MTTGSLEPFIGQNGMLASQDGAPLGSSRVFAFHQLSASGSLRDRWGRRTNQMAIIRADGRFWLEPSSLVLPTHLYRYGQLLPEGFFVGN